ncbi:hypothetical protein [Marinobacter salicampi]|uniref:hypothetical protein n=1 Tax=Marinobacter salicampi TaxID=435907 RepID=UPI001409D826|nr:hypothetical protein [Marinobacter salicampi]
MRKHIRFSDRGRAHLVEICQRRIELIEHIELIFVVLVTGTESQLLSHGDACRSEYELIVPTT